jgi:anti-sigma B factor antagonist
MKIDVGKETLTVSGLKELSSRNADDFCDQVAAALQETQKCIEVDLSECLYLDSCGLGALISIHKTMSRRNGKIQIINPTQPVGEILNLTRMNRIFEIIKR